MKSESLLIRNVLKAGTEQSYDILIQDAKIAQIAPANSLDGADKCIDGTGKIILPGLCDLHAHLGQPGNEARERIANATAAARSGGILCLQAMPDSSPMMDNAAQVTSFHELCDQFACIDVIPSGCVTKNGEGEEQAAYDSLRNKGVRFITDADHVPTNLLLLHRAMQYAGELGLTFALRGDVPQLTAKATCTPSPTAYILGLVASPPCAEEIGTEAIIRLSQDAGAKLHIQCVSTSGSVDIIRRSKQSHPALSAEVALHHLLYTHEDIQDFDTNFKTQPPLRERKDIEAILHGLKDGSIDCIVSDHSPCTPFEKKQDFIIAPAGMIALDFFLPTLYTKLITPGLLSWENILQACCVNPRRLLGLADINLEVGAPATQFILFDPTHSELIEANSLHSRARNSPLIGNTLQGKVIPL